MNSSLHASDSPENHNTIKSIAPTERMAGLIALKEAITQERKDFFLANFIGISGHFPETQKSLSINLETEYASFEMRFIGLRNCTDDPSEAWEDVAFMEEYTKALFATFFTKATFASVFPDEETKEKYFALLAKYIYTDDFDKVMVDARTKFPRNPEHLLLTTREKMLLLL